VSTHLRLRNCSVSRKTFNLADFHVALSELALFTYQF